MRFDLDVWEANRKPGFLRVPFPLSFPFQTIGASKCTTLDLAIACNFVHNLIANSFYSREKKAIFIFSFISNLALSHISP